MFISRRRRILGSQFDTDASLYFTTASITDGTEKSAANTVFTDLKSNSLYTKLARLYLVSPTSAAASLYCAKTLTQMTNVNAATHSALGVTFDGATQYYATGLVPSSDATMAVNSAFGYVYSNSGTAIAFQAHALMGSDSTASRYFDLQASANITDIDWFGTLYVTTQQTTVNIASISLAGGWGISRTSSTDFRLFKDGSQQGATVATLHTGVEDQRSIALGAHFNTIATVNYAPYRCAGAAFGSGLTTGEMTTLHSIFQAYETALSRNN